MITALASVEARQPLATQLADVEPVAAKPIAAPLIAPTPPQQLLAPPRLLIELDLASARFVQTIVDPGTDCVLRTFPENGQIAFSRGVAAYANAMGVRDATHVRVV